MENTKDGCVILKKKEYEDLLEKAGDYSKNFIVIGGGVDYSYKSGIRLVAKINEGSINLSGGIHNQINRILSSLSESLNKSFRMVIDSEVESLKSDNARMRMKIDDMESMIKNMSYWEFRKLRKHYNYASVTKRTSC